jgi:hypothetical protein
MITAALTTTLRTKILPLSQQISPDNITTFGDGSAEIMDYPPISPICLAALAVSHQSCWTIMSGQIEIDI